MKRPGCQVMAQTIPRGRRDSWTAAEEQGYLEKLILAYWKMQGYNYQLF